jgi:hypothetical protein
MKNILNIIPKFPYDLPIMRMTQPYPEYCKIAIKTLAILQTGDLPAILRYRTIFAPHRIPPPVPLHEGDKGLIAKIGRCLVWQPPIESIGGSFPKNQYLFLGKYQTPT